MTERRNNRKRAAETRRLAHALASAPYIDGSLVYFNEVHLIEVMEMARCSRAIEIINMAVGVAMEKQRKETRYAGV